MKIKASEDASSPPDANELFNDLKEKVKIQETYISSTQFFCHDLLTYQSLFLIQYLFPLQWDALENKSTVIVYGGGAVVAIWISSILVGAVNSVPLVCFLYLVCIVFLKSCFLI